MKVIVIIVPTYNEKENISPLIHILLKTFKKLTNYRNHILFVDDNSPDGTSKEIHKQRKRSHNIHIITNKRKSGLGKAYKKGMTYALKKLKADIIFEFDADLSHDAKIIPKMLRNIENGSDLVLGSRYIRGGGIPQNWPPIRKLLSRAGNLFINLVLLDFSIRDWTTGYRAITKQVVKRIIPNLQHSVFNGYTWQIGFLIKTIERGFRVSEIAFVFKDRTAGKSKLGPEYMINTLVYIMKVRMKSLLSSRIFKFVVVGGIGALIQLTSLGLWRNIVPSGISYGIITTFQIAFLLSIETAIISNFILSNVWTFSDRKLKTAQIPSKFLTFNLTSGGSILIQQVIAILGENFIGLFSLFIIPVLNINIDTGIMYAVIGILLGMFWNFFAYTKIIWKKKK